MPVFSITSWPSFIIALSNWMKIADPAFPTATPGHSDYVALYLGAFGKTTQRS